MGGNPRLSLTDTYSVLNVSLRFEIWYCAYSVMGYVSLENLSDTLIDLKAYTLYYRVDELRSVISMV